VPPALTAPVVAWVESIILSALKRARAEALREAVKLFESRYEYDPYHLCTDLERLAAEAEKEKPNAR